MKFFIYLLILFSCFPFFAFSIEVTNDLFIEEKDEEDWEDIEIFEQEKVQPEIIKKKYKKQKVIIKRDISSLDEAMEKIEKTEDIVKPELDLNKSKSVEKSFHSKKNGSFKSLDYGEYEIHWSRK